MVLSGCGRPPRRRCRLLRRGGAAPRPPGPGTCPQPWRGRGRALRRRPRIASAMGLVAAAVLCGGRTYKSSTAA
jgi:hypothetical protein